ncbi:MAG: CapA family protein [Clostridium cadaveris]|uniref:CapA family protein n=1 Tax=Clostridium cadaveris TaxID=1529 RepID=UPI002A85D8DC|nr:CapA family protein [Clostridium cadaveris]
MGKRTDNNNTRQLRRKKLRRRKIAVLILALCFILGCTLAALKLSSNHSKNEEISDESKVAVDENKESQEPVKEEPEMKEVREEILLTFAGDCTLGTDTKFGYAGSLPDMFENQNKNYSYFFKNVYDIFSNDDYTLVNLETPLTDATVKADKGSGTVYHFKGPKDYINILTSSSIEGVSIANNHMNDYGKQGLTDTVETLSSNKVDFCGKNYKIEKEIKGTKFLFLGYEGWSFNNELKNQISNDIKEGKNNGSIVIPYFHWGIEKQYQPYDVQINLAHFSIDEGADMVIGSHPHVIQSLENYNNKLIVYSLGNFSFGGNFNPSDKRTFILQTNIKTLNGALDAINYKVIPASISSVDYKNDYAPTPMTGDNKVQLLNKLNSLSPSLNGKISDEFFSIQ